MFGVRLRELRREKGLTMKELGKKFSLAESTISGYENGNRKPDLDMIDAFADYFEVSTDYLLGRTDNSLSIFVPNVGSKERPLYKDIGMRISAMITGRKIPRKKILELLEINSDELLAILNGNASLNDDQAEKLSSLLDVRKEMLLPNTDVSFKKDEKDIAKRLEQIKKDLESGSEGDGLAFHGEPMSEEAIDSLMDAMELIVRQTQRINKKYIPKKYRDKETE